MDPRLRFHKEVCRAVGLRVTAVLQRAAARLLHQVANQVVIGPWRMQLHLGKSLLQL